MQVLRWHDIDLLDAVLRVRDSKTEEGVRSIALSPKVVEALSGHYARTAYKGDGELVFCHPERGTVYRAETFETALEKALCAEGITDRLRAFHDLRHRCITNDAAAGASPIAAMAKAGRANMRTTQTYLHLAGVVFCDEAERLKARLLSAELSSEVSTRLSTPEPTLVEAPSNGAEVVSAD